MVSRRKKITIGIIVSLVALVVIGYLVANAVLERVSRQALNQVVRLADEQGLEIVEPSYESVGLTGFMAASWSNLQAGVKLPEGADSESVQLWNIQAKTLTVKSGLAGTATVSIDQAVITSAVTGEQDLDERSGERRLEFQNIRSQCDLEVFDPKTSLKELLPELIGLLARSETQLPLQLEGTLSFRLKGKPAVVGVEVRQEHDINALRLNHDDLARLSGEFDEKLTAAEVALIADYPLRAARLLQIKERAESAARQAHEQDESVPQDAYRHVLWSYLLARTYDEDFAKRVGDAHEEGDTGNSPAERDMDYHNNAVGRSYAAKKFARDSILARVLADPDVRREP